MSLAFKCDCCERFHAGSRRALIELRLAEWHSDPAVGVPQRWEICHDCCHSRLLYLRLWFRNWTLPRIRRTKR